MGLGACRVPVQRTHRRPRNAPPLKVATRVHCDAFYWNLASAVIKIACLGAFGVVEGPRRLLAIAKGADEVGLAPALLEWSVLCVSAFSGLGGNVLTCCVQPVPRFTCQRWGFRMCACGHHYYDHGPGGDLRPVEDVQVQAPIVTEKKKRRKRFWFF